jgi:hypothetical protein
LTHDQLHKSALVLKGFPRSRFFASAHADDDLAKTNGFTWLHFKIAGLAVSLVQKANNCDAFRHWRSDLPVLRRHRFVGTGGGFGLGFWFSFRLAAVAA